MAVFKKVQKNACAVNNISVKVLIQESYRLSQEPRWWVMKKITFISLSVSAWNVMGGTWFYGWLRDTSQWGAQRGCCNQIALAQNGDLQKQASVLSDCSTQNVHSESYRLKETRGEKRYSIKVHYIAQTAYQQHCFTRKKERSVIGHWATLFGDAAYPHPAFISVNELKKYGYIIKIYWQIHLEWLRCSWRWSKTLYVLICGIEEVSFCIQRNVWR